MDPAGPAIQVEALEKSFGTFTALAGVDFAVARGEVFGFLGPNGAGKTTAISILAGLVRADGGAARLAGHPAGSPAARSLLGVVPQELALYDDLTARENLAFFGALQGLKGRRLRDRIEDVLARMALADRAGSRVGTFSGGMKRRLNLGASLLHEPEILLLDEPTVGVDPQSRSYIFDTIEALAREGRAVVYTTHYMEEAERLCRRIAIMDRGSILARGTLAELLSSLGGEERHRFRVPAGQAAQVAGLLGKAVLKETPDAETGKTAVELGAGGAPLHECLGRLERGGIEVLSAELVRPNLEWLFLELTGRRLRD